MTPRELAGAIRAARVIVVHIAFGPGGEGVDIDVSQRQAHLVVEAAQKEGVEDIDASVHGGILRIGSEIEIEAAEDGPEPVCSGCGEPWEDDHECEGE